MYKRLYFPENQDTILGLARPRKPLNFSAKSITGAARNARRPVIFWRLIF
jgi:hypothetical protein